MVMLLVVRAGMNYLIALDILEFNFAGGAFWNLDLA
jgi:hypothetical protein